MKTDKAKNDLVEQSNFQNIVRGIKTAKRGPSTIA